MARALVGLGAVALMVGGAAIPAGAGGPKIDPELLPTLEVVKVVEGPAPEDGIYTIEVSCADFEEVDGTGGGDGDGFVALLEFNADGSPHRAPGGWDDTEDSWILAESWDLQNVTCTVSELAGGAATTSTPSYDCAFSNEEVEVEVGAPSDHEGPEPGCLSTDPSGIVRFGYPGDESCSEKDEAKPGDEHTMSVCVQNAVVTVTNTFPEPTPEPEAAAPAAVVVTPKFTG